MRVQASLARTSDTGCRMRDTGFWMPVTRAGWPFPKGLASHRDGAGSRSIRHLVPGTRYPVSGTRYRSAYAMSEHWTKRGMQATSATLVAYCAPIVSVLWIIPHLRTVFFSRFSIPSFSARTPTMATVKMAAIIRGVSISK